MKLIILNGPPGAGKSSVAEALHQLAPPLTFLLKADAQRRFLKDRHVYSEESSALTYKICKAIAGACLSEGKDVILERVVIESATLDMFVRVGKEHGADVFEFILWADKGVIVQRNVSRPDAPDALPDTKRVTAERAEYFWNKIEAVKNSRPHAQVIDVGENSLEQVIEQVKVLVGYV